MRAAGTIIDEGEVPAFYIQKFHMFSSPVFLGALALLGASLMNSTGPSETSLVKVARRSGLMHWPLLNASFCLFFSVFLEYV